MPKQEFALFEDAELTKPVTTWDPGRLPLGRPFEFTLYLKNFSEKWPLTNIHQSGDDPDLKIKDFPEMIPPGSKAAITLEVMGKLSRRTPIELSKLFIADLWIG